MAETQPTLAATDSVNVSIQPFKKPDGSLEYHGNISYLDQDKKTQYVIFKGHEPLILINYVNDALRDQQVVLSRVSGEIPPLPEEEPAAATAPTEGQPVSAGA